MSEPRNCVLIVEDETDVAMYLAAALEDEGFEVLTASEASEGLTLARTGRPDLICLDLVMPGRTGLSLYREIRRDAALRSIPVVVVSGVSPEDAAGKLGFGESLAPPDAFIEKPVELPRFLETVAGLLAGSRGRT